MNTNQKNTQLLLTHGGIQVSPQEVALLNQKPNTQFDNGVGSLSSRSGYQVILNGYADHIFEKERPTKEITSLRTLLNSLRSMPRSSKSYQLKNSVSTYSLSNDDYRVDYRIHSGQVVVFNIQLVDRLQKARDSLEKTATYKVKKNSSGIWQVAQKVDDVPTDLAAVNGQSNNLAKATWLMGQHLEVAYGKNITEYTLFHNPSVGGMGDTWESVQDKFGFTTDVTKQFASLLNKAQKKESDTRWVAHSQGGLIFAEGVRYLLNGNSSWALNNLNINGLRNANKGTLLNKQKITFHANANNNIRSKQLFERAGIDVVAIRAHDYDFVTNMIGMNTANPRKLLGSIIYANHVTGGSINQSPHTTVQSRQSWEENMRNGPGKGRNGLQNAFNKAETKINNIAKTIKNYLP